MVQHTMRTLRSKRSQNLRLQVPATNSASKIALLPIYIGISTKNWPVPPPVFTLPTSSFSWVDICQCHFWMHSKVTGFLMVMPQCTLWPPPSTSRHFLFLLRGPLWLSSSHSRLSQIQGQFSLLTSQKNHSVLFLLFCFTILSFLHLGAVDSTSKKHYCTDLYTSSSHPWQCTSSAASSPLLPPPFSPNWWRPN